MYNSVRDVLGPKWSIEILDALAEQGPLNYTDIENEFETSSDVIASRLEVLRKYGLIERSERTARDVRYSLTSSGQAVLDHVTEIEDQLGE